MILILEIQKPHPSTSAKLSYISYDSSLQDFNKSLFYQNINEEWGADPCIIYINEGSEKGYYYLYTTSSYIATNGVEAWRSKNLTDWECVGPVFMPDTSTNGDWWYKGLWAPSIMYLDGLYYLFYSAPLGSTSKGTYRYDSYATSPSPKGPFVDKDYKTSPMLVFEDHYDEITDEYYKDTYKNYTNKDGSKKGYMKVIGPHPFVDDDGSIYLFFVADLTGSGETYIVSPQVSSAYAIKLNKQSNGKLIPDYSSLTRITEYGKIVPYGDKKITEYGNTNEGPVCFKYNDKYYLTFLTSTYYEDTYQTRLAVADNVLGPYTKLSVAEGGAILKTVSNLQRQGAGIRDVISIGGQTYGAYMTFLNNVKYNPENVRKFAIDEMVSVENKDGTTVFYTNGPSVTPQPLPEAISGYKNLAPLAKITSLNSNKNVSLLNDRVIPYSDNAIKEEYIVDGNRVKITFDFNDYVTLRSILVYNSRKYNSMFDAIDSIDLYYKKNNVEDVAKLKDIKYNWNYYDSENNKPAVGSAAIAEFADIAVNRVVITINKVIGKELAIPEIILLGKETVSNDVLYGETGALFDDYFFENEPLSYTNDDWKNTINRDSNITIDGVKDAKYSKVNESFADYDLYSYKGLDGIYLFVDVNDNKLHYEKKIESGKYCVGENSNTTISIGKSSYTGIKADCASYRIDISNEAFRYVGIESQNQWLRAWGTGASAVVIKDGNLNNLTNATGYSIELFVPYTRLNVSSSDEVSVLLEKNLISETLPTVGKRNIKTYWTKIN